MTDEIVRALTLAVDAETPREERARNAVEIVRNARGFRRVGIYDVGDEEVSLLGWAGSDAPAHRRFPLESASSGDAVRTRATVVRRSEAIVPILGAESGIVIGTLDAESDPDELTGDDVAFLERCAAILRPLYD